MANRKIRWNKVAVTQFQQAIHYIAQDSPGNAEKVASDILKKIEKVRLQPEMFPPDKYKQNNDGSFRAFELYRLRIAYFTSKEEIRILRVRHTSQEPKTY